MSLAAKLPYDHAFAGGFSGIGSQPLPADADALDYLSRMATADGAGVEVGVATAVDAFFRDTKAAGVFDALKACCILAGARTLAGALVPVVGDAPTNVADGFVEGDYSRTAGLTGDAATTYLDTGRADTAEDQDDIHLSVYIPSYSAPAVNGYFVGAGLAGAGASALIGRTSDSGTRCRSNTFTSESQIVAPTLFAVSRQTGASYERRLNESTATVSVSSNGRTGEDFFVFATNDGGVQEPIAGPIAFYSIGTSLSLEDLDTAVTNLITAIGNELNVPLAGGGSSTNAAPTVTLQPTNETASEGSTATFTSAASGSPTPTVQWQLSTDGGSSWADIGGANATSYTTSTLLPSDDQNQYRAVFTNSLGTATTNAATLTVDYFFEAEWLEVGADAFNPTDLLLN